MQRSSEAGGLAQPKFGSGAPPSALPRPHPRGGQAGLCACSGRGFSSGEGGTTKPHRRREKEHHRGWTQKYFFCLFPPSPPLSLSFSTRLLHHTHTPCPHPQQLALFALLAAAALAGPASAAELEDKVSDLKAKADGLLGDALSAKEAAKAEVEAKESKIRSKAEIGYPFDLYDGCIRTAAEWKAAFEAGESKCVAPWLYFRAPDSPADLADPEAAATYVKGPGVSWAFVGPGQGTQGILNISKTCKEKVPPCSPQKLVEEVRGGCEEEVERFQRVRGGPGRSWRKVKGRVAPSPPLRSPSQRGWPGRRRGAGEEERERGSGDGGGGAVPRPPASAHPQALARARLATHVGPPLRPILHIQLEVPPGGGRGGRAFKAGHAHAQCPTHAGCRLSTLIKPFSHTHTLQTPRPGLPLLRYHPG